MNIRDATDYVIQYDNHEYVYSIVDDGTVIVGGRDHDEAIRAARKAGYHGQIKHYASHLGGLR